MMAKTMTRVLLLFSLSFFLVSVRSTFVSSLSMVSLPSVLFFWSHDTPRGGFLQCRQGQIFCSFAKAA